MKLSFYKYQATGNDFVMLDNRDGSYSSLSEKQVKKLCDRRFGIGGDGLIMIQNKDSFDFEMIYFNSDGKPGSMCGNGGRCAIKFAYHMGLHKYTYRFMAVDGEHEAEIANSGWIRLKMQDAKDVKEFGTHAVMDTGSPHYVKFVNNAQKIDVVKEGRAIRNNKTYEANGINVNFVENTGDDSIYVRTYERGVEDETLSCGTGVTAAALVSAHNEQGFNRVEVKTIGGNLSVEYNKNGDHYENIWLCGSAEFVFKGEIEIN